VRPSTGGAGHSGSNRIDPRSNAHGALLKASATADNENTMRHAATKGRSPKARTAKQPTVRRSSRVQRGRATLQAAAVGATSFARWTIAQPWDGLHLGAGLVDISQLACECGECWGCQQRVG
jgi:hypothetical protein